MSQGKEYVIWSLQNLNIYYPFGAFILGAHACVRVYAQSCLTLCDPIDCSQSGSSVYGISQAIWSVLPFPPPRDFSNPGIQPVSLVSSVLAGGFFAIVPSGKTRLFCILYIYSF